MRESTERSRGAVTSAIHAISIDQRFFRWIALAFALPLFAGWLAYNLVAQKTPLLVAASTAAPTTSTTQAIQKPEPVAQAVGELVQVTVGRNDTLDRIFRQARLNLDDLAAIRKLPGMQASLDALKPGESITITHLDGALQKITRRISDTQLLSIVREPEGFASQIVDTPLEVRTAKTFGVIESSLFNAARAAGVSSDVVMRLANDVFGWDIDFALEIQPRDTFSVIYEQKYRDKSYLGDGQILAAEFINEGRVYRALRFESADGSIADFFTPDGKSMRKQFLRAPVDFKYISSNFALHRLHPILNVVRAHQGVDYSAPIGTPVRASGDGRISHIGEQGGYGNSIILEHGGSISTLYGHLSRFAKGMHVGSRVKQGEVVGYVGNTGAATGPHLHYEYRVNGVHKNPRTIALPDAQPIPPAYQAEFESVKTALLTQLDTLQQVRVAARP